MSEEIEVNHLPVRAFRSGNEINLVLLTAKQIEKSWPGASAEVVEGSQASGSDWWIKVRGVCNKDFPAFVGKNHNRMRQLRSGPRPVKAGLWVVEE